MKPTLLLLAAGMGTRYGGLKQLDGVGPNGETIMDYSIYDAIRAGFGKAVFVIRKDFEEEFRNKVLSKYENLIETEIVFQDVNSLPEGYVCPEGRIKPWGTNHAILASKNAVKEPFCVINCDDFYNKDSFMVIGKFLSVLEENTKDNYAMVGFSVANTLSENGTVSRGVCEKDSDDKLISIVERTKIKRIDGKVCYYENDQWNYLEDTCPVSMNMWGFSPDYFDYSESRFREFLDNLNEEDKLTKEFYIPSMVDYLIQSNKARVKVISTDAKWFGVTYAEDRESVVAKIQDLIAKGVYPHKLF